jgi:hypothetical protein
MRKTLALDDDVLDKAKAVATELDWPFRRVVNEALRSGLQTLKDSPRKTQSYRTIPHKMGLKSGRNPDNIQELLY